MSTAVQIQNLSFAYGSKQALHDVSLDMPARKVTAFIGPSGCGKSTLIRCINRINDRIATAHVTAGTIKVHGIDIYREDINIQELRRRVGMVFQKPNPFPMSIFDNVVYALRVQGEKRRRTLEEAAERALKGAALWEEVKDRLKESALGLSGGQQQRLCIARAIVVDPEVLLLDEPCSALDPIATVRIEELIQQISARYTVIIVTHNMQQAARISDYTAFMYLGRLIEYGATADIFQNPKLTETEEYVTGRFG